ncbi:MAG: hypothetical protein KGH62_00075 [Candidatus Micrarchaeota archaeon]|nr:hypothetical protein [Candidatus Micrarchaeota archaeon]
MNALMEGVRTIFDEKISNPLTISYLNLTLEIFSVYGSIVHNLNETTMSLANCYSAQIASLILEHDKPLIYQLNKFESLRERFYSKGPGMGIPKALFYYARIKLRVKRLEDVR